MKELIKLLIKSNPLYFIIKNELFISDSHNIVSREGWKVISEMENKKIEK